MPESTQPAEICLGFHFTMIPDSLIDDETLSAYDKAVFLAIARHASKEGIAFPSISTIAKKAGCSETSVKASLSELNAHGYIEKAKRQGKAGNFNVYTLIDPALNSRPATVQTVAPRLSKQSPGDQEGYPLKNTQEGRNTPSTLVDNLKSLEEDLGLGLNPSPPVSETFKKHPDDFVDYVTFVFQETPLEDRKAAFIVQRLRGGDLEAEWGAKTAKEKAAKAKAEREKTLAEKFLLEEDEDGSEIDKALAVRAVEAARSLLPPELRRQIA